MNEPFSGKPRGEDADGSKRGKLAPANRLPELIARRHQLGVEQACGGASVHFELESSPFRIVPANGEAGKNRNQRNEQEEYAERESGNECTVEIGEPYEGVD